jgi:hypothetical protein
MGWFRGRKSKTDVVPINGTIAADVYFKQFQNMIA